MEHVAHDTGLEDPFSVLVHREHVVEDGRLGAGVARLWRDWL